jgi:hypothetical protein
MKLDIDEIVETFARMSLEQRAEFVDTLVYKWPHMAESIKNMITLQIMVSDFDKAREEARNV